MTWRRLGVASSHCTTPVCTPVGVVSSPAAALQCAARTHMNGFGLFVRRLQRSNKAMRAGNLKEGQANMPKLAAEWAQLSNREKQKFNAEARAMRVVRTSDAEKKDNLFNLIMKLLAENNIFTGIGSEKLNARVARETVRRLTPQAARRLERKYNKATPETNAVSHVKSHKSHPDANPTSSIKHNFARIYKEFHSPSMRHFKSFTEMQRAVCPTAQAFFTSTCLLDRCNVSQSTYTSTAARFHLLPPDAQHLFGPITDAESPAFEAFCARPQHCASQHADQFNIVLLAALFRHLPVTRQAIPPNAIELLRRVGTVDRLHDGPYNKTQRCLRRTQSQRSSDFGEYLFHQLPDDGVTIPRGTYGIQDARTLDDVVVARLLAATRHGQSVYDDVLSRAAQLRPTRQHQLLKIYDVAATAAERKLAVSVAPTVKPVVTVVAKVPIAPLEKTVSKKTEKKVAMAKKKTMKSAKKATTQRAHTATSVTASTTPAKISADETPTTLLPVTTASQEAATQEDDSNVLATTAKKRASAKATRASGRGRARAAKAKKTTKRTALKAKRAASDTADAPSSLPVAVAAAPTLATPATATTKSRALPAAVTVKTAQSAEADWENAEADDAEDDLAMFGAETDASSSAETARRQAALAAISALGLRPAKASQRLRSVPVVTKAATAHISPTKAATKTTAAAAPTRKRGARKVAKAPAARTPRAAPARPRARQQLKAAAVAAVAAVTGGKKTASTAAAARAKPRETREERQRRVGRVLLTGKQQRILHRPAEPASSGAKRVKVRRGAAKHITRATVSSSLTNALRAQLSNMHGG